MPLVGWVLAEESIPKIVVRVDGKVVAEAEPNHRREDIESLYSHSGALSQATGWAIQLDVSKLRRGKHEVSVAARCKGEEADFGGREFEMRELPDFSEFLRTIAPLLRCPETGGAVLLSDGRLVLAVDHGKAFPVHDGHVYMGASGEQNWTARATSAVSISHLGHQVLAGAGGLVLVLGAGLTDTYENAIQLDIFDYPNVEIVTGGGTLPFQDGAFAGVVCENVIEHVPDPPFLVKEIERVLRPGGLVSLIGTSMYFTHGFPSHYFNPTRFGMEYLLEKVCRFRGTYELCDVAGSLHAILHYYFHSLRPDARELVGGLQVADFIRHLAAPAAGEIGEALRAVSPHVRDALTRNVCFFGSKQ